MNETSKNEDMHFCNMLKGSANMSPLSMMFATILSSVLTKITIMNLQIKPPHS